MSDMECPYCGEDTPVPDDCEESDIPHEAECRECGKAFIFHVEYYPSFSTQKAPCLNGGEHDWQPIVGWPQEYFENKRRCSYCEEEKTIAHE